LKIQKKFKAQAIPGIKILRYEESLYYANVEYFKYQIYKQVGLKPEDMLAKAKRTRAYRVGNKNKELNVGNLLFLVLQYPI
jgi:MFS superfamily sulfate permease-like transporter